MIRQAITCDICASEKKQTNHWFVAHEQGGELRLTSWNSRNRLRVGSKHLCGQTCLHKLVDEFMARNIEVRVQANSVEEPVAHPGIPAFDGGLTSVSDFEHAAPIDLDASACLIAAPEPIPLKRPLPRQQAELVAMPARPPGREAPTPEEASRYTSRNWRSEAWDREREREMRAVERRPDAGPRRRSGS